MLSLAQEVGRLADLKEQGHLSEDEFEAAKKRLFIGSSEPRPHESEGTSNDPVETPVPKARSVRRVNGLSIAALILGLVGLGIGSALALVFGYRAKRQIDESEGQQSGRGMAIAGIVLGWIGAVGMIAVATVFLVARANAQGSVKDTLWSLFDAQVSYTEDNPGRINVNGFVLKQHGYEPDPGVDVRTYLVRGGGYCAEASDGGLGGTFHTSDQNVLFWGEVQTGECADDPYISESDLYRP